ncbi:hypothetical protein ACFQX8_28680 [Klenkia terrae]
MAERAEVGLRDIGDVHEVPHLAAVLEDLGARPPSSDDRKIEATPA